MRRFQEWLGEDVLRSTWYPSECNLAHLQEQTRHLQNPGSPQQMPKSPGRPACLCAIMVVGIDQGNFATMRQEIGEYGVPISITAYDAIVGLAGL
jgi:hypothetical protein